MNTIPKANHDNSPRAEAPADRFTILRALGHLEPDDTVRCADHLAKHYLDEEWADALPYHKAVVQRFAATAPGAYPYALARTRYFDQRMQALIDAGVRQFLLVGSGFDSRAERFHADTPLSFFELDHADVHATKAARRAKADLPRTRNRVWPIPVDLARGDVGALRDILDIDRAQPVAVLAEGLLYYLPERFFRDLLEIVGRGASGSALLFDFAHPDVLLPGSPLHGASMVARFARESGEAFHFTAAPEEVERLCAGAGLELHHHMDDSAMAGAFLCRADGSTVGLPFGGFHLACALKVGQ